MNMRKVATQALVALCMLPAGAQATPVHQQVDTASVDAALSDLKEGLFTGISQKQMSRLGDRVAAEIILGHTLEEMKDESLATAIAEMIAMSFAHRSLIENEIDRTPKMSILLLCYLKSVAKDDKSIAEIEKAQVVVDHQLRALGANP